MHSPQPGELYTIAFFSFLIPDLFWEKPILFPRAFMYSIAAFSTNPILLVHFILAVTFLAGTKEFFKLYHCLSIIIKIVSLVLCLENSISQIPAFGPECLPTLVQTPPSGCLQEDKLPLSPCCL